MVVFNHGSQDLEINAGDRIAQLIVGIVASLDTDEVSLNDFEKPLSRTFSNEIKEFQQSRGMRGYGSSDRSISETNDF